MQSKMQKINTKKNQIWLKLKHIKAKPETPAIRKRNKKKEDEIQI